MIFLMAMESQHMLMDRSIREAIKMACSTGLAIKLGLMGLNMMAALKMIRFME